ncbi:hypothetical protein PHET_11211 [Paragonimus heterotremus]|uniref:Uncharacterized protein n=1 Tax=Paragonimus heterotremus TaxID=100268 RepID=A0A8J4WDL5_9TREM|nr:hypothetical protein PHET_11211 [Paragonimus heterotremus]
MWLSDIPIRTTMNLLMRSVSSSCVLNFPRFLSNVSCRSLKLVKPYEPQISSGVGPNLERNNTLPKEYERLMQKVIHRIGPSVFGRRRLYPILLSRRAKKCSEEVRLASPNGRLTMYRQLIRGKRSLWNHDW